MNTTAPTRTKVPLRSVHIQQHEGPTGQLINVTVASFAATDIVLARICAQVPAGRYHKCSVTLHWNDGMKYEARYDATSPAHVDPSLASIAEHVRKANEFNAGYAPGQLDPETYAHKLAVLETTVPGLGDRCRNFLKRYSLKDDPNAKPATIERNDRPRSEPAPILRHPDPAPAKPMDPAAIVATRLQSAETMLTVILADLERALPLLLALKTEDRANDVARYAKAQKQALEIRKALAAVIKARE